jgi:hypothetical protein
MTVTLSGDLIRISGAGRVEDAETLVALLQADRSRAVDLADAAALHTAVVQALLAFRPGLHGVSSDPFFNIWLMPGLTGALFDPPIVTLAAIVAETSIVATDEGKPATPLEQT